MVGDFLSESRQQDPVDSAKEAMAEQEEAAMVCVTGASGFLGSCLVDRLLRQGIYHVRALVRSLGKQLNPFHRQALEHMLCTLLTQTPHRS